MSTQDHNTAPFAWPLRSGMRQPKFADHHVNGVRLRVAEMGEGPLLLLIHGWPELGFSWRFQMQTLADAGYKVVVPDMRGFGQSDAPDARDAYTIQNLTSDVVGLIDIYGEEKATIIGHDWGAIVTWNAALLYPERFEAMVAMSVPYTRRDDRAPIELMRETAGENFFYIVYFQDEGLAEAEFDADPKGILSQLYSAPDTPRAKPTITDPRHEAGGWIGRMGEPLEAPDWLTTEELDFYVEQYRHAGFRGGINYYRNIDHNWRSTPQLSGATVDIPALFIAGEKDMVIRGANAEKLRDILGRTATDLRDVIVYPDAGHWIQQERAEETNRDLLKFLTEIYP